MSRRASDELAVVAYRSAHSEPWITRPVNRAFSWLALLAPLLVAFAWSGMENLRPVLRESSVAAVIERPLTVTAYVLVPGAAVVVGSMALIRLTARGAHYMNRTPIFLATWASFSELLIGLVALLSTFA
jgi:hypothetical protein